jgi:hypothetical protein
MRSVNGARLRGKLMRSGLSDVKRLGGRSGLSRLQWLIALLGLALGIILLLLAGNNPKGVGPSVLREAGIVTLGTVLVSLVYEFILRRSHELQLLDVVTEGLLGRARDCGLSQIDTIDFIHLFKRLKKGDELWWLDTYCPDMSRGTVQAAIQNALERGVSIRMLVIDPDCFTAKARAEEIMAEGYTPDNFQESARTSLRIIKGIKQALPPEQSERLEITEYSDLPCAPMYLRLRGGQPIDGWTSYFLTRPTYEAAHFNWGPPGRADEGDSPYPGLGLDAFREYFEAKWIRAIKRGAERNPHSDRILDEANDVLRSLRNKHFEFASLLISQDLAKVIKTGVNVLADGKLRRDQNASTRDLLLELATGCEILLVHSTSENRIFEDHAPVFWQSFNQQLQKLVGAGELAGVRRLFIVESWDEVDNDDVLSRQIAHHTSTLKYECRILLRATYDEIQRDLALTATPVHDFGIYGDVAYVWQRAGYSEQGAVHGYFQVDGETVQGYRDVFEQCWSDGSDRSLTTTLGN